MEPLFRETSFRFVSILRDWPKGEALESFLQTAMQAAVKDEQHKSDAVAAARIIAMLPREPTLRSAHLLASAEAEAELAEVFAARLGRKAAEFDLKLCAAAAMAAIRIVDEDICTAVITDGLHIGMEEATARLAAAIRAACTLPVCDPVGD